jgi:hypothetical protein
MFQLTADLKFWLNHFLTQIPTVLLPDDPLGSCTSTSIWKNPDDPALLDVPVKVHFLDSEVLLKPLDPEVPG